MKKKNKENSKTYPKETKKWKNQKLVKRIENRVKISNNDDMRGKMS